VHGLVALFLEVIVFAIILLFIGLVALRVLIIATRTIVASIVLMTIAGLLVVAIMSVALMVVAILVATMLLVASFTGMRGRKMSHLLFFWLLFILGNLLKNVSHFVSRLTLCKESNELERFSEHCLVCNRKLKLICLQLCKEDFFTPLLHHG
jgi:hypothetical protein